MSSDTVKQKIILAAINCIEANGLQKLTVRMIAESANVNIAAVNYHFGSKENLLKMAMQATLQESFVNNINDYHELWETDPKQALRLFLTETLKGAIAYPNLSKAHLQDVFNNNNYDSISVSSLNDFLDKLHNLIKSELKQPDEPKSRISVSQLFSVVLMIGMMPDLFNGFLQIDLKDKEQQEIFLQTLLANFVK